MTFCGTDGAGGIAKTNGQLHCPKINLIFTLSPPRTGCNSVCPAPETRHVTYAVATACFFNRIMLGSKAEIQIICLTMWGRFFSHSVIMFSLKKKFIDFIYCTVYILYFILRGDGEFKATKLYNYWWGV